MIKYKFYIHAPLHQNLTITGGARHQQSSEVSQMDIARIYGLETTHHLLLVSNRFRNESAASFPAGSKWQLK